jgi:membrane-associated phospholipid phosphatase
MGIGFIGVAAASTPLTVAPGLIAGAIGFGVISTLGFPLFTALIPKDEEGGYTALFFSVRSIASAIALPVAGFSISLTGSFRALFAMGAAATLIALIPLATVPSPGGPGPLERAWRRIAGTQIPPWRWWARGVGIVAAVFVAVMAIGLIVDATFLQSVDEWGYRRINSFGPGGGLIWDAFNPHTRNYEITALLALATAALTRPRLIVPVLLLLAVAFLLAAVLLEAAQEIWDRPRPEEAMDPATLNLHGVWASFESYPSGHMIITTALAAATALAFPRLWPVAWAYIAIIGVTRIVFGAHFPLDVLTGTLFGYVAARVGFALVARLWPVPEWRDRLRSSGSTSPD